MVYLHEKNYHFFRMLGGFFKNLLLKRYKHCQKTCVLCFFYIKPLAEIFEPLRIYLKNRKELTLATVDELQAAPCIIIDRKLVANPRFAA